MDSETSNLKPYICKEINQMDKFHEKYLEYDGRGILIAIIDDIIDFSLPGMQKTTTGLPKVVDCFNFSCKRFINISTVKKVDPDGFLYGLSGLKLQIPSKWKNPSGKWHLGLFGFYMLRFDQTNQKLKENEEFQAAWKQREENEGNKVLQKITESLSPYADCIVWFDGEKWRVCIDTSFSKNLENIKILTNFQDENEFGILWDKIPYCIKIHSEKNQLEIISAYRIYKNRPSNSREHGTKVTHVAAAHYPKEPHKDGLSPGAQIISMCISRSTDSLKKALLKCIEMRVDIVNFSIKLLESREISKIVKEMVEKYGIIFVICAKNDGPLYTSIQQDYRNFHDHMFVIGSIFTTEMMNIFHKDVENNNDSPILYYYSSKGILNTGARGIDFTAPGAVITAVPKWCKTEYEYCSGTSFATPNVTGLIACLLSALNANSIHHSPELVKFVLSKTAFLPPNGSKLEFGNGIPQICAAFEFFKMHFKTLPKIVFTPKITVHESKCQKPYISIFKKNKKGILLVKTESENITKEFCINLKNKNFVKKQWNLKIEPDSTKFVEFSETVKNGKIFVKINTSNLQNGSIYYAEIHGSDVLNPSVGSLFYFPITVIVPEIFISEGHQLKSLISLDLNTSYNLFISAPAKAKRCIIKLTNLHKKQSSIFVQFAEIHRIFVSEKQRIDITTEKRYECCCYFPVNQQKIYEISFYQIWFRKSQMFNLEISFDQINIEQKDVKNITKKKKKCKFVTLLNKFLFWIKSVIL